MQSKKGQHTWGSSYILHARCCTRTQSSSWVPEQSIFTSRTLICKQVSREKVIIRLISHNRSTADHLMQSKKGQQTWASSYVLHARCCARTQSSSWVPEQSGEGYFSGVEWRPWLLRITLHFERRSISCLRWLCLYMFMRHISKKPIECL